MVLDPVVRQALDRLVTIALRNTRESRRVANFLLAWWDAEQYGGFDLTDLWELDAGTIVDLTVVIQYVARIQHYPDTLGYTDAFDQIIDRWRKGKS